MVSLTSLTLLSSQNGLLTKSCDAVVYSCLSGAELLQ